jgi:hypothetical protein
VDILLFGEEKEASEEEDEEEHEEEHEEEQKHEDEDEEEHVGVWGPAKFLNAGEELLFRGCFSVDGVPKKDRKSQAILERYNEYYKPAHIEA